MYEINERIKTKLIQLSKALIDQKNAKMLIAPHRNSFGFWFGAGNMVEDNKGNIYLVGRYRDSGDSRAGLMEGERGVELAIFKSEDSGINFDKIISFSKKDLSYNNREVVSIEGACLHFVEKGVELYVSTEKLGITYPKGLESYRKPGTGVWTIDLLKAQSIEKLKFSKIHPILEQRDPRYIHLKDPVVFDTTLGNTIIIFCTHPFNWSSANSGMACRSKGSSVFDNYNFKFFPRGFIWDVAICRITGLLALPKIGLFADLPSFYLLFYDGGESMRQYDEHPKAVKRPRGYSCEELGGLAFSTEKDFPNLICLSRVFPFFVSPLGTGSNRYIKILKSSNGIFATWQRSQQDLSQALFMNFLNDSKIKEILYS